MPISVVFYKQGVLSDEEQAALFDDILAYLPSKTFKDIEPLFDGCLMGTEPDDNAKMIYDPPYNFKQVSGYVLIRLEFEGGSDEPAS